MAASNKYWFKQNDSDRVYWLADEDNDGEMIFSFDKIKKFYLYSDYPSKLTAEQRAIFDKDCPQWKAFFASRG